MHAKKLTDEISVSGQLKPADVATAAEQGFKSILCQRPDGEGFFQPKFEDIAAAAEQAGLAAHHQPFASGGLSEEDADEFARLIKDLPKPILAFCRTGTRSTALWTLAQAGDYDTDDILKRAADAGYNMRALKGAIEARASKA